MTERPDDRYFTLKQIAIYTATFLGVAIILQRGLRFVNDHWIAFDCPYYWPISIFTVRLPGLVDVAALVLTAALFGLFIKLLERYEYKLPLLTVCGVILIAGTTLIQGFVVGYYSPIAGDARSGELTPVSREGQEYYHDALRVVKDPVDFFRRYNEYQPTMSSHGHTHPPGATLLFYFLEKTLRDPGLIAVFLMLVSASMSAFFVYRLARVELSERHAGYLTFLFLLLPAIQIYYLATIDALVTGIVTGVLYLFCFGKGWRSSVLAWAMLVAGLMLTFVCIFIFPILAAYELLMKKRLTKSVLVIGGVIVTFVVVHLATGYNAWAAFREASHYENPNGFMLLVDPANYLFTRLEDVAEILFFFGPFLIVLFFRDMRQFDRRSPLMVLTVLGCLSVLGMYAVGAWRTGETARACAFIYPYLLFPIGKYLEENDSHAARTQLAILVFAQTLGMQTFGSYFW